MAKALSGPPAGLTVRTSPSTPAQTAAGRVVMPVNGGGNCAATAWPTGPLRHGTLVPKPWAASPATIDCCPAVGAKILRLVSTATEPSASQRSPSYATNRQDLPFLFGNALGPPTCS